MRTVGIIVAAAFISRPAWAGPPSAADAQRTAQAWMDAMGIGHDFDPSDPPPPAAVALTATPFWSNAAIDGPDPEKCKESTAKDAAAIGAALGCLRANVQADGKMKAWSKKVAKEDGLPRFYKKQLARLAKTARLVVLEAECAGTFNVVVFAVSQDAGGTPKVAAVLSANGECGE